MNPSNDKYPAEASDTFKTTASSKPPTETAEGTRSDSKEAA
jgi:hypothetical protein